MLTNSLPADAPSRRVQPQVFVPPRQLNPRLSPATEAIILRALEQDPHARFQSAEEMQRAILANGRAPANTGTYPGGAFPAAAAATPLIQRRAPPPVAQPPETVTPARTTFEREVLPLVVDIGSSIYRAIKEQSTGTQTHMRHAAVMGQLPVYASPPATPVKPTPAPPSAAPPPAVQVEAQGEIVAATVDGKPFDLSLLPERAPHRLQFTYYALPDKGFELQLSIRSAEPIRITVQDVSNGLPSIPGMTIQPRPAYLMPALIPTWRDPTMVSKSFMFAR